MAFILITKDGKEHHWHINSKVGKPKFDVAYKDRIIDILQVTGDELEVIKKHFDNIPITNSICTWRGDMAQFIYDNL